MHAPLPPGVTERDPAAWAQRRQEYEEKWAHVRRLMVDFLEFHKYCPRHACRRVGACQSKTVACHEEAFPILREHFYPRLRAAMRAAKTGAGATGKRDA
jgi:hypothetical protein